jgi:RND family efflux transporter MFP subunit
VTLQDHTIEAPFDGVVGIPRVEVGDRVSATTALVNIDDRSKLVVEFDVPEVFVPRLSMGRDLDVRTPGFPQRVFKGVVSGIDSRVDPQRRTIVVRAEVDNANDLLRPGMSFAIDLVLEGKPHPRIPDLALQFSNDGNFVWRLKGETVEKVSVEIIKRISDEVLVSGNLKPGDPIVLEGVQRLRPGRKVRRVDPDASEKSESGKNASARPATERR